eukprot:400779-Pyramimonas_sp.AAC.1
MVSNPRRHALRPLSTNRLPICDLVVLHYLLCMPCCSLNAFNPELWRVLLVEMVVVVVALAVP